jgi:transcription-repair coupling factor (superfamily II helicase)
VSAKEKLRSIRANVDTLTLTATPIPRTLNFSLMGARDLSLIETPPRNRLPVQTSIIEWDNDVLHEAIARELERGGQLYLVNDSIHELDEIAMRLVEIMPGLRFGIAHGQMDPKKLENVMERFLERKFDVLLSTKIVESGLDIPNVNTMIINHADRFGLAELYQLRGRVGRSNTQAYCYLCVPPVKTLNRTAIRRLQAIEEHTDLGSGFHLAMRDLEIRGAGNLLGAEQSGFIAELGLETYQKIVDEAVRELRHDEFSGMFPESELLNVSNEDLAVELDGDALLPESYVLKDTERFEFYKRLFNARTERSLEDISGELRDRYGALPPQAENLLFAVRLRLAALPAGFDRLLVSSAQLTIEISASIAEQYIKLAFPRIVERVSQRDGARFKQNQKRIIIEIPVQHRDEALTVVQSLALDVQEALVRAPKDHA